LTAKMSRTSHLKELQEELRLLFDQGISEQDAYNQLKDDPRFGTLRLAKITTIYNVFRSEQAKKPKRHKPAENLQLEILQLPEKEQDPLQVERLLRSEQFAYFRSMFECDHKKNNRCLRMLHIKSLDGRFFVRFNQMPGSNSTASLSLLDTFSKKSSQIKLSLDPMEEYDAHTFHPLTYDIGLLAERTYYDDENTFSKISVSLLELDWTNKESRKLHTVTIEDQQQHFQFLSIIVDEMDPAKFILRLLRDDGLVTLNHGSVIDDEIFFNDGALVDHNFFTERHSFAGNELHVLDGFSFMWMNTISAGVTDLEDGTESISFSFDLSQLSERFSRVENMYAVCFNSDRVFMATQFKDTQYYGIIWSKLEAQQWIEMDFCVKEPIKGIQLVADGSLLLVLTTSKETKLTRDVHRFQTTLYRIPLKKPEKLSGLAWFSLVRSKSRIPNVDPYDEARKYLPYTSEIQFPFEE